MAKASFFMITLEMKRKVDIAMQMGQLVGRGRTADVYDWSEREVVKVFHHLGAAEYEANNARIINQMGLSIRTPEVVSVIKVDDGREAIVYEKIEGQTMLRLMEATQESLTYYGKLLAEIHAALHEREAEELQTNVKPFILKRLNEFTELSGDEANKVRELIDHLPDDPYICHLDFHPDNIMISAKGPVVIDFTNFLVGHKYLDVMKTSCLMRFSPAPHGAPQWLQQAESRLSFNDTYLKEYMDRVGENNVEDQLKQWELPAEVLVSELYSDAQISDLLERMRALI
ncbi:aminoglycoside phosphotransferase family protein [Bacillus horti]|uniref:Aminoglycoside phosphotransferase (APT) family kinase protein n=1 Tax=Caldalkalibacillus horti TaxID=77523 RepID=A0ABT9VXT2_9BACI|nr:aminoglycoside phosphotransferase family protein [Bacillus horti]MDQ0165617.1 aminoglycoside phosphotransferase (APT) family kinase protein [Bacillus horti]